MTEIVFLPPPAFSAEAKSKVRILSKQTSKRLGTHFFLLIFGFFLDSGFSLAALLNFDHEKYTVQKNGILQNESDVAESFHR